MKYQRHFFKNVRNEQLLIVINFNSNNINQIIDDHFRKHQETTKIRTSKQFSPQTMLLVLENLAQNKSINQIAKEIHFSAKAIRNNLKKALHYSDLLVDENGKKIKNLTKFKKTRYRLAFYSFKKWFANYLKYNHLKKINGLKQSQKKFDYFLNWLKNNITKLTSDIRISANVVIYSFEQHLKLKNFVVPYPSEQTIYNWVFKGDHQMKKQHFLKLAKGLPKRHQKRQKNLKKMRNYDQKYLPITALPIEALLREGDHYWELDTFEGKKSDNCILLVMVNRKTRNLIIKKINRGSESMLQAIKQIYDEYNLTINGLIIDNGSENALLHLFDQANAIYRCRPNCPTDKPGVENVNRLIRYWIPKKTSIDRFSDQQIKTIEEKINSYPRKIFTKNKLMSSNDYQKLLNI